MSAIKAILWDIDGTLLDFKQAEYNSIKICFEKFGFGHIDAAMIEQYSEINRRYWEQLEKGLITKSEVLVERFKEFFSVSGLDINKAEAFNAAYQIQLGEEVFFVPHALEVLVQLKKRGIKQYAVTNGTKLAQDKKLAKSGLEKIFDGIFISEDIGVEKPNIEFFTTVFKVIGDYEQKEIMIVGDSLTSDIKGGNNAGILTCWFNPSEKAATRDVKINFEIKDVIDVLKIMKLI